MSSLCDLWSEFESHIDDVLVIVFNAWIRFYQLDVAPTRLSPSPCSLSDLDQPLRPIISLQVCRMRWLTGVRSARFKLLRVAIDIIG